MQVQVINFIEDLYFKRNNLIINTQTNLLKKYKERNDIKLFLIFNYIYFYLSF